MTILKDLVGSDTDKEGKKVYKNCGYLCDREDGSQYVMLTCFGKPVFLNLYDHKKREPKTEAAQYRSAKNGPWDKGAPTPASLDDYGAGYDE